MKKSTKEEKENAKKHLLALCPEGTRVFCVLRHVAASGMSRNIDLFVVQEGDIVNISYHASKLTGYPIAKSGGIRIGGCGMDMGFALVYELAQELYGPNNGYALKHNWL